MPSENGRILGRTGIEVCRLGISASYGAPTEAFEEAFDRGVNYFYFGSRRTAAMARAVRNIVARGGRDRMIVLLQSYSRSAVVMEYTFQRGLKSLGLDRAEILLLGWHNSPPSPRIMERAQAMREKGLFKYLAVSGHNRLLFPGLMADSRFDIFHVRYNAVHRGAEDEVFSRLPAENRPGIVTYTATRWGDLLNPKKMPPGRTSPRGVDCYRFVLSNPAVDVCMTGPRNRAETQEALKALDLGPLSAEEMAGMRLIGDHIHDHHRRFWAN